MFTIIDHKKHRKVNIITVKYGKTTNDKVTPAIKLLKQHKIEHALHEYEHDVDGSSYGLEAAEKLAIDPAQVYKTLVVELAHLGLAVGVIPVSNTLSMKAMAKNMKCRKASMATPQKVERSTGYVLGGVSPLGQKKQLITLIDDSALQLERIFVSAGRRGLEIELDPRDLSKLLNAQFAALTN